MFASTSKDNSNLYLKLLLRKTFLELAQPEKSVAVDFFAGGGEIAKRLYLGFEDLHLVERDEKKFSFLEHRFSSTFNVHLWKMDNIEFIRNHLPGIPDLSVADFDAYGSPNRQLLEFFKNYRIAQDLLIFATDGAKLARLRARRFSPKSYFAGLDEKSAVGYDPVLVENYEQLIFGFWKELADRYAFKIEAFKLIWKKSLGVAYYGVWLRPKKN